MHITTHVLSMGGPCHLPILWYGPRRVNPFLIVCPYLIEDLLAHIQGTTLALTLIMEGPQTMINIIGLAQPASLRHCCRSSYHQHPYLCSLAYTYLPSAVVAHRCAPVIHLTGSGAGDGAQEVATHIFIGLLQGMKNQG